MDGSISEQKELESRILPFIDTEYFELVSDSFRYDSYSDTTLVTGTIIIIERAVSRKEPPFEGLQEYLHEKHPTAQTTIHVHRC